MRGSLAAADVHLAEASALLRQGLYQEAILSYHRVLLVRPQSVDAYLGSGNALMGLGRIEEAVVCYRAGLKWNPHHAGIHNNLGVALQRLGKFDDAIASFGRVLKEQSRNADAHNNLGNVLLALNDFAGAAASFRLAVAIEPKFAGARINLGNALLKLGECEEAAECYRSALLLNPKHVDAHIYLGDALQRTGQLPEAAACYRQALALRPDYVKAHIALGDLIKLGGDLERALEEFSSGGRDAYVRVLETLYQLDDHSRFNRALAEIAKSEPNNIVVAAISSFVAHQWGIESPYGFCKNPFRYLQSASINADSAAPICLDELAESIKELRSVWQPYNMATRNGFQTSGNIFDLSIPGLNVLRDLLAARIGEFRRSFAADQCGFIKEWPQKQRLVGWSVRLLRGGFQDAHIHPSGWLSGVVYLKMPSSMEGDAGGIEFSLRAFNVGSVTTERTPRSVLRPQVGDVVLFPSSLFHRTIPFQSDEERICIAFDVTPT